MTGVPAPAGAGLAFAPVYLWLSTGLDIFRAYYIVGPWIAAIAFLMISNVATYSWSSLRLRKNIRLEAIALAGLLSAALITAPWPTLLVLSALYLVLIPFGISSYAKVKRLRRSEEHTSELQSLRRISYAVFCLKKKQQRSKI